MCGQKGIYFFLNHWMSSTAGEQENQSRLTKQPWLDSGMKFYYFWIKKRPIHTDDNHIGLNLENN